MEERDERVGERMSEGEITQVWEGVGEVFRAGSRLFARSVLRMCGRGFVCARVLCAVRCCGRIEWTVCFAYLQ